MHRQPPDPLRRLAQIHGILVNYWDAFGVLREVPYDTLLLVLRELGAPVETPEDAPAAIREHRQNLWRRVAEPVAVIWEGGPARVALRLPARKARSWLRCELALENGETHTWRQNLAELKTCRKVEVESARYVAKDLPLPVSQLPQGYHHLHLEADGLSARTLLLSAPTLSFSLPPEEQNAWGVFLPLYAASSERSWGAGHFSDLADLMDFTASLGGKLTGALPLLASFLDTPCDPSPYTPVSRQFWNEFYLDVTAAPEFEKSAAAKDLVNSEEVRSQIEDFRRSELVDYKSQMALKRRVLEELVHVLACESSERRDMFRRYVKERPTLESYARFRATTEKQGKVWPEWPARLRDGKLTAEDYDQQAQTYHLYVQWLADEQLSHLPTERAGLYLDLPLGVHPGGFDVWQRPEHFALGVNGGAPPDRFFTKGQSWGFAPLQPERARLEGYDTLIACLRHHLRYARLLRVDHVMGLHRLFWVPNGLDATQGAYVGYRSEELYAILNLESWRHQAAIVGEDLGTVPDRIRASMETHGLRRMYVAQFEFDPDPANAIHPTPPHSLVHINTHDMRPFTGYWQQADIDDQLEFGLLSPEEAENDRRHRENTKFAVIEYLRQRGRLGEHADAAAVLRACLQELAERHGEVLLVNLEDLWGEVLSQNTPGTVDERPNWRRRARHVLEEIRRLPEVVDTLRQLDERRRRS